MNNTDLDMLKKIGLWLCKQLVETNADTLTHTIKGFHNADTNFGDFEITVKRVEKLK